MFHITWQINVNLNPIPDNYMPEDLMFEYRVNVIMILLQMVINYNLTRTQFL